MTLANSSTTSIGLKRLDAGTFRVPDPALEGDVARLIEERAFDDLIDGIDIESRSQRRRVH